MLTINIITLFPNLFTEHLNNLPLKKAIENKSLSVNIINLRDYALDSYGTVDDKPYGGGVGMLLRPEPIYNALKDLGEQDKVIVLSPSGKKYAQEIAQELAETQSITLICGRYEGIDARIKEYFATDVISIGDYVLSGGELPALVIMESITRLLPGVLEKKEATQIESFSKEDYIEFPQYTRPEDFRGHKVPGVLLSGDHKKIAEWRKNQSSVTGSSNSADSSDSDVSTGTTNSSLEIS